MSPAPKCGNVWWKTPGIILDADTNNAAAFAYPLTCVECGHVVAGD